MTTIYTFSCAFTKAGIGTVPSSAPVCTVVDSANNILANAQATTALTNLPGVYLYSYSGADGLRVFALMHTTDTTMDQQDLYSYTPERITSNLNVLPAPASTALSTAQWTNALATALAAYTAARGAKLDNLDAAISSRAAIADYTPARAVLLDALGYVTGGGVTIMPPVLPSGQMRLVCGDSYKNAEGRALEWTSTGAPWPTDLAGYTITLYAGPITKTGSVVVATGTRKVRVELLTTDTTIPARKDYRYKLVATKTGEVVTLAMGEMWAESE